MKHLAGALYQYDISVRVNPDRGGPVCRTVHATAAQSSQTTQDAESLKISACRHILLLIHGFNDTAEQAAGFYDEMIAMLVPDLLQMNEPDAIVCFQWPGDYAIGPLQLADAVGYPVDIDRARQSAPVLLTYLRELCAFKGPGFKISVIAHSMGCRLLLELLNASRGNPLPIAVAALMAAAVPVALVEAGWTGSGGPYLVGTDTLTRAMLKFHSSSDWVLWLAFPAGESLAFAMGKEPAEFIEAVGYLGDPTTFAEDTLPRAHGHSDYWDNPAVEKTVIATLGAVVPKAVPRALVAARRLPQAKPIAARPAPAARPLPA